MQKVLKVINKKHCKDQPDKPKRRVLSYVLKPQGVQRDMPMRQAIRIMRYLIHLLAISGSGNLIHLPMSLFKLGALCTCVSVLICHPKTNKLLDTSLHLPQYLTDNFLIKIIL